MKHIIIALICVGFLGTSCGGGGGGATPTPTPTTVSVSFTPTTTATGVSLSTTATATFSAAISEPLSWYKLITLQKNGTGSNLCTSVSYNSTNRTISCGHAALDQNSSYTLTVSGVKDSSNTCIADATGTFTTSGTVPISSVAKTSITSTSGGSIDLTFNFSSAIPSGVTPSVSVSSETDATVTAGTCTLDGGRTSCTSTISDVAGCNTPTDYTATLSMTGYENYETSFNSADNEFETAATVSSNTCWTKDNLPATPLTDFTWEATGGKLVLAVANLSSEHNIYYDQPFASSKAGAFAVHVSSLGTLATSGSVFDLILVQATNSEFDGLNGIISGYNGLISPSYTGWLSVYNATSVIDYKFGAPSASGDLSDIIDMTDGFYVCQTAYNNLLTTYISTDGENYIKLTDTNMECANGASSCGLAEIDSRSISTWANLRLSIQLGSNYSGGDNAFSASFGFARFKTSNLNGSMADCPRMIR